MPCAWHFHLGHGRSSHDGARGVTHAKRATHPARRDPAASAIVRHMIMGMCRHTHRYEDSDLLLPPEAVHPWADQVLASVRGACLSAVVEVSVLNCDGVLGLLGHSML